MKKNFYVASDRISIRLRCVTLLCVRYFFQHEQHKDKDTQIVIEALVAECLNSSKN